MHVRRLKTTNIGAAQNVDYSFENGLIVVRGANAAGKSTTFIRSLLYGLFGSSTLEASLEEVTTRGESVNTAKVEVELGEYTVRRSKASASVIGNGTRISGQNEVSKFFYDLFGIQKGTEESILVSRQNETAGIFKSRPAEVTSTIESIAGFSQIDELIEKVKDKFPSGSKDILEDNIATWEIKRATLEGTVLPDTKEMTEALQNLSIEILQYNEKGMDLKVEAGDLALSLKTITEHNLAVEQTKKDLAAQRELLQEKQQHVADLEMQMAKVPAFRQLELAAAQDHLANFEKHQRELAVWGWVKSLQDTEDVWEGDYESFCKELLEAKGRAKEFSEEIAGLKRELQVKTKLLKEKEDSKECPECKQDVTHIHAEFIAKTKQEISALQSKLPSVEEALKEEQGYVQTLEAIDTEHKERLRQKDLTDVAVMRDSIPHSYFWMGEIPEPLEDHRAEASQLLKDHAASVAKLETLRNQFTIHQQLLPQIEKKIMELEACDLEMKDDSAIKEQLKVLEDKLSEIKLHIEDLQKQYNSLDKELAVANETIANHNKSLQEAEKNIKNYKEALAKDLRNGKILQAVRAAKPKVLDQVWDRVLVAVSEQCREIMGDDMRVEKTVKGFYLNGSPVTLASGAEKATLGIALRCALRDIFAPGCGFILFDEPFADMSDETTAGACAVFQAIPGQVFVITHESQLELVSGQFIEVEKYKN